MANHTESSSYDVHGQEFEYGKIVALADCTGGTGKGVGRGPNADWHGLGFRARGKDERKKKQVCIADGCMTSALFCSPSTR